MAEDKLGEEQFRRILCKEMRIKHNAYCYNDGQWTTIAHPIPIKTPAEEDLKARRQISTEVMNLQLQVHKLAARLALKENTNKTDALQAPERIEVFGRIAQTYAVLNENALKNYREAVEGVNNASWEDLTEIAEEAPTRRAELEEIIRQLEGGEDRQEAASEAEVD
ncbi:hypothetical protein CAEBREN_06850 [Caenorhabditis brenneri]|uniref:Uncharacterized protein n=1 Tax=Caenorhabditis brenneri TaxID=135651 RepID=G0ND56_CAEBE|nr:hypothetical protein CAEBREN_06850 [Caenorhabditis brenneri]